MRGLARAPGALATAVLIGVLGGCTAPSGPASADATGSGRATSVGSGATSETDRRGPDATSGGADGTSTSNPSDTPSADATAQGSSGEGGAASETLPTATPTPAPTLGVVLEGLSKAPADAQARGSLVAGFPSDLVPVPTSADVVSSSVSSQGDRVQVGLEATAGGDPDAVRDAYVEAMTKLGYLSAASPAVEGSTATQFSRGRDSVVLTLRPQVGGGTELLLVATLVVSG